MPNWKNLSGAARQPIIEAITLETVFKTEFHASTLRALVKRNILTEVDEGFIYYELSYAAAAELYVARHNIFTQSKTGGVYDFRKAWGLAAPSVKQRARQACCNILAGRAPNGFDHNRARLKHAPVRSFAIADFKLLDRYYQRQETPTSC